MALALLLCLSLPAAPQSADGPRFAVRGFDVRGPNPLGAAETERILRPFMRDDASMQTLQQASAALEAAFRERGYRLHFVQLPAQELGDTVVLEVAAATLDAVHIEGNVRHDERQVRRALPALEEGTTPDFGRLAVQTSIANENPNRQLQVNLREAREPGRIDAVVQVSEKKPWNLAAALSNAGTRESGRDRLTLTGSHSNVFGRDHQLAVAYTTSLERLRDVKQIGVAYTVPLYRLGAVAALSHTHSDVVGRFGDFTSTGAGHATRLSFSLHRPPEGPLQGRWIAALEDRLYRGTQVNGVDVGTDRRSRPLSVGYALRSATTDRAWALQAELVHNTGSGSDLAAYQSEYPGIRTVRWLALRADASWLQQLPGAWVLSLRGNAQYSADALIAGEQFGLGGPGSVRGTATERPIAGDRGLSLSAELQAPTPVSGLQALLFLDAGWVGNVAADRVQRIASDRLVGAGLGLRYASGRVYAGVEYGRLLVGSRMPRAINSLAPQQGDDRLYLNVGVRF